MTAVQWVRKAVRSWFGGPISSSDPAMLDLFGARGVTSGVTVSEESALALTAVWACVQLIAGTLGSLPLFHYRQLKGGGKEKMTESRIYRLLHDAPNEEMTSTAFRETLQAHVLLWGNGLAEISRDGGGRVAALWPIEPWRVTPYREERTYALRYRVWNQVSGTETVLRPDQVIHIPGLSGDGVWGWSVIRKAREAVGLGLATERFGAAFFGNGSTFGGVLTHPARLSDAAREHLTKSIKDRHQGVDRAHDFIILEEGLKYERLGIPPEDAQFLETRKFQRAEIASLFGVPPHMIGDVERSTSWGTGIEQQAIGFVTYNLRRWLVRWEQELTRKLISPAEFNHQAIGFLVDGLLRGDTAARYQAYNIGRFGGWFSANDIRELENMNPIPGAQGDQYWVPANMQPPGTAPAAGEKKPVDPLESPALQAARDAFETLVENVDLLIARPVVSPVDPGAFAAAVRPDLVDVRRHLEALQETIGGLPPPPPPADLTLLVERLDAESAEVRERLGGLQEAVAALPTATPPPADLTPVLERIDALEAERRTQDERLTPLVGRLDAVEADRRAHNARLAAVLPPLLAFIERAVRDFYRREGDRARRAAASREKLTEWIEDFYPRQGDYGVKVLGDAMEACFALQGRQGNAHSELRALVGRYVTESMEALTALVLEPPEDLRAAVDALATRWETDRPAAVSAALLQEVLTDASAEQPTSV